jgi:hypothetical protein
VLEGARAVDVVGERCKGGMKELMVEASDEDKEVVWERLDTNDSYIGQHPTVMDPHERKSVYVGESMVEMAGEGLFAKKMFSPVDRRFDFLLWWPEDVEEEHHPEAQHDLVTDILLILVPIQPWPGVPLLVGISHRPAARCWGGVQGGREVQINPGTQG